MKLRTKYALGAAAALVGVGILVYGVISRDAAPALQAQEDHGVGMSAQPSAAEQNATTVEPTMSLPPADHGSQTTPRQAFGHLEDAALSGLASLLYAELLPRARAGDADAAWDLVRLINECRTRERYEIAADGMPDLECDLESASWDEIKSFLVIAAEYGNVNAQINFMAYASEDFDTPEEFIRNRHAFDEFSRSSERYLTKAAAAGSVSAMSQLAGQYEDGLAFDQDLVKAYAYLHALNRTEFGGDHYYARMESVGGQLSPQELSDAMALGDMIFRRCCG